MTTIKLLHTADIHIGMENYGRIDPETGIHGRVMDFLRRLSDIGDYAIAEEIDLFVFAGDAYRTRDPNPTYQREFARRIKRVADADIPVLLLVGNHDMPAVPKRATSISIFDTLDVPNVYVADRERLRSITCRRGQILQIATVPYPLRSAIIGQEGSRGKSLAEIDELLRQSLIDTIRGLGEQARQQPDLPAILVGHFGVNEASPGSEQNIMIGRDASIPKEVLSDPVWRYVALGHIHRHQSLNPKGVQPPIVFSGSIERIDFGEEREPKGFVVAEIDDDITRWRFVSGHHRQARRFVTARVDVQAEPDPTAAVVEAIRRQGDLTDCVVRVIITLRQEQESLITEREITQALESAYFVGGVQRDVIRAERRRLGGVSIESLTSLQVLERYLEVKEFPPERVRLLIERAGELMRAADGDAPAL